MLTVATSLGPVPKPAPEISIGAPAANRGKLPIGKLIDETDGVNKGGVATAIVT
jgi:hypothetical protein